MRRVAGMLALVALGCGAPAAPARHAPEGAAQDGAGAPAQESPVTHPDDAPTPVDIPGNPFTDVGPKCKKSVPPLPDASLPIATSEEGLAELLGCKTTIQVDWSREHVVPVSLEGFNMGWSFMGLSTMGGVATITIETSTIARGAAVLERRLWLVRIPAASTSVVIRWTSAPEKPDGALYP
jgi:hypothetical protein